VNGPSHYVKGEELAEHAEDLIKQGDPDGLAPVWAALAHVHATLAEAAAAALGTSHLDALTWAEVARTTYSDVSPKPRHTPLAVPQPDRPGRTATREARQPIASLINDPLLRGARRSRNPARPPTSARVGKGQAATAGPIPHPSCQTCASLPMATAPPLYSTRYPLYLPECADTNRWITYSDGSGCTRWHRTSGTKGDGRRK
jgi:hypothetical protein